jgi:chromosome segregation ATPase
MRAALGKLEGSSRRSKRDLTLMYVLCLFFSRHRSREVHQIMIRTGSDRKLTEPGEAEQQAKDLKRLLAKAEQQIRKLQEKVADQKQQIREFQAQAKHEDGLAAEREELKAEIADLKGEIRELIRANREQVENLEALRAENARLKAGAKVQSPSNGATGGVLRESPQPLLS